MAGLMSQRQALVKLLDVLSQQIAVALIAQSWVNGSFQLSWSVDSKHFPHIALDHPCRPNNPIPPWGGTADRVPVYAARQRPFV